MRKTRAFILTILLITGLVSCNKDSHPLRIAYQDRVGDAAAILAVETLTEDVTFRATAFSSGSLTAEALISGNADIATMGDAVAVSLAARYPDTVILLGIHGSGKSRHQIISHDETPQTIGVKFGTSTHAALLGWLEYEAQLVDLSPSLQLAALASGEIDALAASEPTPSIAYSRITGMERIPLEADGKIYPLVLVASRKAFEDSSEEIGRFIEVLSESGERLEGSITDEDLGILSTVTGLERELLGTALSHHQFFYHETEEHLGELSSLAEFLLGQGKIPVLPDWERVLP